MTNETKLLIIRTGLKHEVIAEKLGVSLITVRSWSSGIRGIGKKNKRKLASLVKKIENI